MSMPRGAASLIRDDDDSVENENGKDFAPPPPKKLKGEQVNSSVPMSQDYVENEKDFAPPPPKELEVEEDYWYIPISQDSVENEKELEGEEDNSSVPISQDSDREAREAFNRWRQLFEVNYTLKTEEERRFKYFKDYYFNRKVNPFMEMFGIIVPRFADRNKQEFNALTSHGNLVYCSVSLESLDRWEEIRARFP